MQVIVRCRDKQSGLRGTRPDRCRRLRRRHVIDPRHRRVAPRDGTDAARAGALGLHLLLGLGVGRLWALGLCVLPLVWALAFAGSVPADPDILDYEGMLVLMLMMALPLTLGSPLWGSGFASGCRTSGKRARGREEPERRTMRRMARWWRPTARRH